MGDRERDVWGDDWRGEERRRGSYSIWKEILGTAAVALPLAVGFAAWLAGLDKQTALNSAAIVTLREQRSEVLQRLDKLDTKLDTVVQQTAPPDRFRNGR
jgi:hypothetical protein